MKQTVESREREKLELRRIQLGCERIEGETEEIRVHVKEDRKRK